MLELGVLVEIAVLGLRLTEEASARGDPGETGEMMLSVLRLQSAGCSALSEVGMVETDVVGNEAGPELAIGPDSGMAELELE